MKGKYHFVKFNNVWYLKAESVQDVIDHFNTIIKDTFVEGFKDYKRSIKICKNPDGTPWIYRAHPETDWNNAVTIMATVKGQSWMEAAHELENKTYNDRIWYAENKKGHLYLSNGLPYAPLKEEPKYQDEQWLDEIMYPVSEFDPERVRYIQWEGGKHWYAKVDQYDVVDQYGNQKWDTKEEAEKAVRRYLWLFK